MALLYETLKNHPQHHHQNNGHGSNKHVLLVESKHVCATSLTEAVRLLAHTVSSTVHSALPDTTRLFPPSVV